MNKYAEIYLKSAGLFSHETLANPPHLTQGLNMMLGGAGLGAGMGAGITLLSHPFLSEEEKKKRSLIEAVIQNTAAGGLAGGVGGVLANQLETNDMQRMVAAKQLGLV